MELPGLYILAIFDASSSSTAGVVDVMRLDCLELIPALSEFVAFSALANRILQVCDVCPFPLQYPHVFFLQSAAW